MEAKHTSGPWKSESHQGRRWISASRGKVSIATVQGIEKSDGDDAVTDEEATAANAAILAAGPDLLDLVSDVIRHWDGADEEVEGVREMELADWVKKARALVLKATSPK